MNDFLFFSLGPVPLSLRSFSEAVVGSILSAALDKVLGRPNPVPTPSGPLSPASPPSHSPNPNPSPSPSSQGILPRNSRSHSSSALSAQPPDPNPSPIAGPSPSLRSPTGPSPADSPLASYGTLTLTQPRRTEPRPTRQTVTVTLTQPLPRYESFLRALLVRRSSLRSQEELRAFDQQWGTDGSDARALFRRPFPAAARTDGSGRRVTPYEDEGHDTGGHAEYYFYSQEAVRLEQVMVRVERDVDLTCSLLVMDFYEEGEDRLGQGHSPRSRDGQMDREKEKEKARERERALRLLLQVSACLDRLGRPFRSLDSAIFSRLMRRVLITSNFHSFGRLRNIVTGGLIVIDILLIFGAAYSSRFKSASLHQQWIYGLIALILFDLLILDVYETLWFNILSILLVDSKVREIVISWKQKGTQVDSGEGFNIWDFFSVARRFCARMPQLRESALIRSRLVDIAPPDYLLHHFHYFDYLKNKNDRHIAMNNNNDERINENNNINNNINNNRLAEDDLSVLSAISSQSPSERDPDLDGDADNENEMANEEDAVGWEVVFFRLLLQAEVRVLRVFCAVCPTEMQQLAHSLFMVLLAEIGFQASLLVRRNVAAGSVVLALLAFFLVLMVTQMAWVTVLVPPSGPFLSFRPSKLHPYDDREPDLDEAEEAEEDRKAVEAGPSVSRSLDSSSLALPSQVAPAVSLSLSLSLSLSSLEDDDPDGQTAGEGERRSRTLTHRAAGAAGEPIYDLSDSDADSSDFETLRQFILEEASSSSNEDMDMDGDGDGESRDRTVHRGMDRRPSNSQYSHVVPYGSEQYDFEFDAARSFSFSFASMEEGTGTGPLGQRDRARKKADRDPLTLTLEENKFE